MRTCCAAGAEVTLFAEPYLDAVARQIFYDRLPAYRRRVTRAYGLSPLGYGHQVEAERRMLS